MHIATSLNRFLEAQDRNGMYEQALSELRAGCKISHWIWYIFPQIAGLGMSEMSIFYSIANLDEARAFLAHPVLGKRLHEAAEALLKCDRTNAEDILGCLDAMKVRSSMTLFQKAAPDDKTFKAVLDQFYDGKPDRKTQDILAEQSGGNP